MPRVPKPDLNDAFFALSDPTRRSILERLGASEAGVTEIAELGDRDLELGLLLALLMIFNTFGGLVLVPAWMKIIRPNFLVNRQKAVQHGEPSDPRLTRTGAPGTGAAAPAVVPGNTLGLNSTAATISTPPMLGLVA